MAKSLYLKMAINNIKQNRKFYIPYIVSAIGMVMVFYIMNYLSLYQGLNQMKGTQYIQTILFFGNIVIGIISIIFLFYINSFLMKRRKKEIGLYCVLGLEKKHIGFIMSLEKILTALIIIIGGIFTGVLFSKLLFIILIKIIKGNLNFQYNLSFDSIVNTAVFFLALLLAILIYDNISVRMSNPIELLKGSNVGEREPKNKIVLSLIGVFTMGLGYYLAITTKNPLQAIAVFFIAVVAVIIGTYLLFTTISITVLKALKKNKKFYYKPNNFPTVSAMLYRMKQNAVGLANICILSTMVLVMVSTTVSLYIGTGDMINESLQNDVVLTLKNSNLNETDEIENQIREYCKINKIDDSELLVISDLYQYNFSTNSFYNINLLSEDYYEKMLGEELQLADDEVMRYTNMDNKNKEVKLGNSSFKVKGDMEKFVIVGNMDSSMGGYSMYVVNNNVIDGLSDKEFEAETHISIAYNNDREAQLELISDLEEFIGAQGFVFESTIGQSKADMESFINQIIGGFLFLGMLLGTVFTCMAAVVIYYKQITEGYYDKDKFEIMQKVGMGKSEVKRTIRKQVLMVFFLPLIVAGIHTMGAFPLTKQLLAIFGLTNITLFMICTGITMLVFSIIYGLVYLVTAREYYKIVA